MDLERCVIKPRHYQSESVEAALDWFRQGKDRPLIVLPTGTGKSLVAALICDYIIQNTPHARIVVAAHVKELVRQNYEKFLAINPCAPVGIVSAGLNKKQYNAPILFGSIQSMYRHADKIGHVDLMIIDEAHVIPPKGQGMWRTFEADLRKINPKFRMCGMTATPYRTTTGTLVGGSNPQFDGICYEYSIVKAIKEGYLSELITEPTETILSTQGVAKRGGEFISKQLEEAVNVDNKTKSCCDEIIKHKDTRKSWLIFSSGNAHAQNIHEYLESQNLYGYVLTQATSKPDRDKYIQELVDGRCQYLVNNMILTTGFDCPRLDLIACLRPTMSAGLWVQMCGRGTRLFEGKENCLLLDFGRNIDRHGPIDEISGSEYFETDSQGEAPIKNCPECFAVIHAAATICPECEYVFPKNAPDISLRASKEAVLSYQNKEPKTVSVLSIKASRHAGKHGKPDTLRLTYTTLGGQINEFVCYDHPKNTYAYQQAVKTFGYNESVEQALTRNWKKPKSLTIKKDGKYYKVLTRNYN